MLITVSNNHKSVNLYHFSYEPYGHQHKQRLIAMFESSVIPYDSIYQYHTVDNSGGNFRSGGITTFFLFSLPLATALHFGNFLTRSLAFSRVPLALTLPTTKQLYGTCYTQCL